MSDQWKEFQVRSTGIPAGMDKSAGITKEGTDVGASAAGPDMYFIRPIHYRPEFASPERWAFPRDLKQRNNYWRMFYMTDAVAGTVVDMYVEMPLSDYSIVGTGVEGEIKDILEDMCDQLRLLELLSSVMKEFLVVGEAVPHLFFGEEAGFWTGWSLHKPENIEVIDTQLVGLDSLLWFTADPEDIKQLRKLVRATEESQTPLPGRGFVDQLFKHRKVLLNPLNVSFVPRLMHSYDVRGMSLFSRLWRVFMWEDAIANATIQTAKRHSSPVKVVKMGDLAAGFIPTRIQQEDLLKALAQSELDPHAWVVVPPTTTFEAWGTTEKIMGMRQEYDTIEKVKLMALGTSRDFISGASTYAAAQAGLQVFLSRLLSFRTFMEEVFIYPKIFGIIAKLHKWYLPTRAEVDHRVRTKRNGDDRLIKPKIRWEKALKIRVDRDVLDAYSSVVDRFGLKISERTVANVVGINWEDELRKSMEEEKIKKTIGKETELGDSFAGPIGGDFIPSAKPSTEIGIEEDIPTPEYVADEGTVPMHAEATRQSKSRVSDGLFLSGVYRRKGKLPEVIDKDRLG